MKCIVKKVLLKQIDQVLESKDIGAKTQTLGKWLERTREIVALLEKILWAIADNKLTEDELDDIKAKIDKIIAEW